MSDAGEHSVLDILISLSQAIWSHDCSHTLLDIWAVRNEVIHEANVAIESIIPRHSTRLRREWVFLRRTIVEHGEPDEASAVKKPWDYFLAILGSDNHFSTYTPPHLEEHYLFFFDGGCRSNPGAGGSGSVIVRLIHQLHDPTVV